MDTTGAGLSSDPEAHTRALFEELVRFKELEGRKEGTKEGIRRKEGRMDGRPEE
jgi:hypothetical protein